MEKEYKAKQENTELIIQSNDLVDSVYKMHTNTKHLFSLMMSKVNAKHGINNGATKEITAMEFGKKLNISKSNRYSELKKAADEIYGYSITIGDNDRYIKYRLVSSAEYTIKAGFVKFRFTEEFLPLLEKMSGNYTKLRLAESLRLKKFASIRLYEKIMQYQDNSSGKGWYQEDIKKLKALLGVVETHVFYPTTHFNTRVLKPAIAEIEKQLQWHITIQTIKFGVTVTAIRINFVDPNFGGVFSKQNIQAQKKEVETKVAQLAEESAQRHREKYDIN